MTTYPVPKWPNMALAISRDGKSIIGPKNADAPIIVLFGENRQETIIGRLDILTLQHEVCGCSSKTRTRSTRGKCDECSMVNQWAVTGLSRRLLRFRWDETGNTFVEGRGRHAAIHIGSTKLDGDKEEWSDRVQIHVGDTICLAPAKTNQGSRIFLKVVHTNRSIIPNSFMSCSPLPHEKLRRVAENGKDAQNNAGTDDSLPKTTQQVTVPLVGMAKRKLTIPESERKEIKLFLVPLGHDMSSVRRRILASKAEKIGALVVDDIFESSHILISQQVSLLREVSAALSVNEKDLRIYIEKNGIPCLLPQWIVSSSEKNVGKFEIQDKWHGDINKRQSTVLKTSEDDATSARCRTNEEIAEVFRTLANLHQSCPLLETDMWKAYMLRVIAGRLTNLDFQIKNDPQTLKRLRQIPGIGENSVDKIQEYLETGKIKRIDEFKSDPKRVAMKNMMSIWGVGRKTALDLIHRGFRDIGAVRAAIQQGGKFLDRNQLVGVECYEDILEEMERDEVQMIGDLTRSIVEEIFPGAKVQIMGSFRRQKSTCGDVDVHITHNLHVKKNPAQGLSKIVDLLWERGHLLFHLTFLPGMKTGSSVSDYQKSSKHIPKGAWQWSRPVGYLSSKGHNGSSYMGVIRSPKFFGKRRRIDIKFYPWRERVFASLYFTGNGHFNRSMRLWASRKFRFTLNDHGLFYSGTKDRVMEASNEREVFDRLELVYKEPHERDCFDAVVGKEGPLEIELSQREFSQDRDYVWVN